MTGISKSSVSKPYKDIDERVNIFLTRPPADEWPYLWLDAQRVVPDRLALFYLCVTFIIGSERVSKLLRLYCFAINQGRCELTRRTATAIGAACGLSGSGMCSTLT